VSLSRAEEDGMSSDRDITHIVELCKTIAENSLYTGQAHFEEASSSSYRKRFLFVGCACVAAVSGSLTACGYPIWIGVFGAAAGLLTGVSSYLGIDEEAVHHSYAGNALTTLRHEADALYQTFARELPHEQLVFEARRLQDRYGLTIATCKPPSNESFDKARRRIKSGLFQPDFKMFEPPSGE